MFTIFSKIIIYHGYCVLKLILQNSIQYNVLCEKLYGNLPLDSCHQSMFIFFLKEFDLSLYNMMNWSPYWTFVIDNGDEVSTSYSVPKPRGKAPRAEANAHGLTSFVARPHQKSYRKLCHYLPYTVSVHSQIMVYFQFAQHNSAWF